MLKVRGNQVDAQSVSEGQIKTVHVKDIKIILPVDRRINEMPDYTKFGKKSKLDLDPNKIPVLNFVLSTRIHMLTTPTTTASTPSQVVAISQDKLSIITSTIPVNITSV